MPDNIILRMKHFGELLGIAFQIKDDILDYQINSLTGKPVGNDIKERKLTLPLIHALEIAENPERKKVLRILNNPGKDGQEFRLILDFVNRFNGLGFAEGKMNEYASLAIKELESMPESEIKALHEFVSCAIEGKRYW
jgi:octaprenyl-diphosphate synthase